MFESIEVLEMKTSILFNFDLSNKTILSCLFFFSTIIDLCFVIPSVFAQIFNSTAELLIPIEIQIKEGEAEI